MHHSWTTEMRVYKFLPDHRFAGCHYNSCKKLAVYTLTTNLSWIPGSQQLFFFVVFFYKSMLVSGNKVVDRILWSISLPLPSIVKVPVKHFPLFHASSLISLIICAHKVYQNRSMHSCSFSYNGTPWILILWWPDSYGWNTSSSFPLTTSVPPSINPDSSFCL